MSIHQSISDQPHLALSCFRLAVYTADLDKGQLISKGLVGILNSSNNERKISTYSKYYDTSGRLVFVRFLEELKTPKSPFEIN